MAGASDAVVDFGDIEDGGGARVRVPEGDYRVKIKSVKFQNSQAGNPMFVWTLVGVEGKLKGKELTEYTALTKKALWKLRDLMEATVGKAPGGQVNTRKLLDHCKKNIVGQEVGVTLQDDEYTNEKNKTFISSKIQDYISIEDLNGDAPEDDADIEDETEEDEDDLLDGMDRASLKRYIKSEDLEVKVLKSMSDDDLRAAIREAQGDEDEEEIEDVDLDEL